MATQKGFAGPESGRAGGGAEPPFDDAKIRIMQSAESLFADRTIDSVSLREIAAHSGNGNTNAVRYHFGDKAALVQCIFAWRVWQMEPARRKALAEAEARGRLDDPRTLIEILCLPLLDLQDAGGKHSYAAFLNQYLLRERPLGVLHAVDMVGGLNQNIQRLTGLIFARLGESDHKIYDYRVALVHLIFANMLTMSDQEGLASESADFAKRIATSLDMATAAFIAGAH